MVFKKRFYLICILCFIDRYDIEVRLTICWFSNFDLAFQLCQMFTIDDRPDDVFNDDCICLRPWGIEITGSPRFLMIPIPWIYTFHLWQVVVILFNYKFLIISSYWKGMPKSFLLLKLKNQMYPVSLIGCVIHLWCPR